MKTTTVRCSFCNQETTKETKEVTRSRKVGRKFFCGNSCHAKSRKIHVEKIKICPKCNKEFASSTHKKAATYCSSSCASADSITPKRIKAASEAGKRHSENLMSAAQTLKKREAWKYVELERALKNTPHEFEFELDGKVFDLVLPSIKMVVEFDGPHHCRDIKQKETDALKDQIAASHGFKMLRIKCRENAIIPEEILKQVTHVNG